MKLLDELDDEARQIVVLFFIDEMSQSGPLLGDMPAGRLPHFVFADYSLIDSGLPGPPYFASVGGLDLIENWRASTPPGNTTGRSAGRTRSSKCSTVSFRASPAPPSTVC